MKTVWIKIKDIVHVIYDDEKMEVTILANGYNYVSSSLAEKEYESYKHTLMSGFGDKEMISVHHKCDLITKPE